MKDTTMVEKHVSTATYAASGGGLIFGLTASEFAAYASIALGVAMFCLNWYYKERADRRAEKALQQKGIVTDEPEE